jgi:hypothetical protein
MLNSIPDAAGVAAKLAEALAGQPGPSAISLVQAGASDFVPNTTQLSPNNVAA